MKKKTIIRIVSVIAILAIGFLGMSQLGSTEKQSNKRVIPQEARLVETADLKFMDIHAEITGNGVIESQRSLQIVSEVNGKILYAKNDLKNGTYVKKGELVVKIDSREIENKLFSLRSDFLNAIAAVLPELKLGDEEIYNKWYAYFMRLNIKETVPPLPDINGSKEKLMISTRNIFTKYYNVKNQEILLDKYYIRAPFSGFIKSGGVIENSFISYGKELFSLSDVRNLEIAVPLLVEEFNMIDFNKNPDVYIISPEGDHSIEGVILRKDTKLSENSQSLNVYISFNNNKLNSYFLPGNYVDVHIQGRKLKDVAVVPRHLIDGDNYIYTMEKDSILAKEKVDIAYMQSDKALIRNTVPENTVLVTTVLTRPLVGMKIKSINKVEQDEMQGIVSEDTQTIKNF